MNHKYQKVVDRIQQLSDEQHQLYLRAAQRELTDPERRRLSEIKAGLQNLWLARKQERTRFRDQLDELVEQSYKKIA